MSKKTDWRNPGFKTKGVALYVAPQFYLKNANSWCENNCTKRFCVFGEALMVSWNFEAEIDCILFKLNWKQNEREYYLILRDDK